MPLPLDTLIVETIAMTIEKWQASKLSAPEVLKDIEEKIKTWNALKKTLKD